VKQVTGRTNMIGRVYDGKFWKAEIAQLYASTPSPPHPVDGEHGIILAAGNSLRGPA